MKIKLISFLLFVALCVLVSGCSKSPTENGGNQTGASERAVTAKHASPGAQAGSHEDWCEEHQVPETLCTRCNPALIAAFKATNDWCVEHGLPESQCRICNPNLKSERPLKKEGAQ